MLTKSLQNRIIRTLLKKGMQKIIGEPFPQIGAFLSGAFLPGAFLLGAFLPGAFWLVSLFVVTPLCVPIRGKIFPLLPDLKNL